MILMIKLLPKINNVRSKGLCYSIWINDKNLVLKETKWERLEENSMTMEKFSKIVDVNEFFLTHYSSFYVNLAFCYNIY